MPSSGGPQFDAMMRQSRELREKREAALAVRAADVDERYEYAGYWSDGGVCRVQIWRDARGAVVMLTQLPENESTSVTNMAEFIAAGVIGKFYLGDKPVTFVEHNLANSVHPETWDRLVFDSYVAKAKQFGGRLRLTLGQPDWRPMTREAVEQLIEGRAE